MDNFMEVIEQLAKNIHLSSKLFHNELLFKHLKTKCLEWQKNAWSNLKW